MAIGIWTPVADSTKRKVFDIIRGTFADKKFDMAPVAGTHMMIQSRGCEFVYYSTTEPTTDAMGLTGIAIPPEVAFVLPRTAVCWIYCPHETMEVMVTVGTLT